MRLPLPDPIRRFARDCRGVGAIEFALVVPLLLVMYLGGSELTIAVILHKKLQHVTSTVDDLLAQGNKLSAADLDGVFNIAEAIMQPYDLRRLSLRVTSVLVGEGGKAVVDWSHAKGAAAYAKGAQLRVPSEFAAIKGAYLMISETSYEYAPMGGYGLTKVIPMGETAYFSPRMQKQITCSDCR